MQRVVLLALLLAGCGSRTTLSTRDAAPYVDDDPFIKLDAAAGPAPRVSDAAGGSILAPDASGVDLPRAPTPGAEAALRDIAKLLWQAEPDPHHLELARSGRIGSNADLERIVRDMVSDPRAAAGVGQFFRWWLGLDELKNARKDPQLFPLFPKVIDPLIADVVGFGVDVTLHDGHFSTLMTGRRPYADMSLSALVGDRGDEVRRAGLLARPGLLALHARPERGSPVKRGYFIRRDVMCGELPPHPTGLDPEVPPQPPAMTNREQYVSLMNIGGCRPCHSLMDDIGFGLENFDAVGAFRLIDHGRTVDATGTVHGSERGDVTFDGPLGLGNVLASEPAARRCIVGKWYQYLRGMPAPTGDQLLARAEKAFEASFGDVREVIVTVLGAHPL